MHEDGVKILDGANTLLLNALLHAASNLNIKSFRLVSGT